MTSHQRFLIGQETRPIIRLRSAHRSLPKQEAPRRIDAVSECAVALIHLLDKGASDQLPDWTRRSQSKRRSRPTKHSSRNKTMYLEHEIGTPKQPDTEHRTQCSVPTGDDSFARFEPTTAEHCGDAVRPITWFARRLMDANWTRE